ncbi:MAG: site-2 protease family protein [Nitrososphaerales archaeon]
MLATGAMLLVGLSLVASFILLQPVLLLLLIPAFLVSFLAHEVAHKILAQRNGLWAEFRTNMYGLMLTFVSVVLPFKFLAPGQTVIQGTANKEVIGAIGLIGPGVNIALGALFFILSKFSTSLLSLSFLELTVFNGWLAVFNLIPFGSFDGTSVYQWDKTRWLISLVAAAFLLLLGFDPTLI